MACRPFESLRCPAERDGSSQRNRYESLASRVRPPPVRKGKSASQPIGGGGPPTEDWRDSTLSQLRELILNADPSAVEEVKWRKPSNPDGVPVWSHDGIICVGNVLKAAVRLTFPKGAQISDPKRIFNTRLDSRAVRAVDFHEGDPIDASGLRKIVREAFALNASKAKKR